MVSADGGGVQEVVANHRKRHVRSVGVVVGSTHCGANVGLRFSPSKLGRPAVRVLQAMGDLFPTFMKGQRRGGVGGVVGG